jgi:Ca-activated chloride channel family protein
MTPHRLSDRPLVAALSLVVFFLLTGVVTRPVADDRGEPAEPVPTPGEIAQGALRAVSRGGAVLRFPLEHTDVRADVAGLVAHVEVVQTFSNPYDRPIEAVYVFPLPNQAAVDGMEIHLEGRVIRGLIRKREEARAAYEEAREEGRTAALVDQERPNIFTQSVANILPGDVIEVHLRYFETLPNRAGLQDFVFPMVVGPRFIPGAPIRHGDRGSQPDTTDVPDASRIAPPVLRPEQRSGHDIALEVRLDAGVRAVGVTSPSHRVKVDRDGDGVVRVRLASDDSIPNRDFVLRYALDGAAPNLIVLPHRPLGDSTSGYFLALLRPEAEPPPWAIAPKEMIFVVDCSGSMSGEPIAKVREAMNYALQNLNPLDNFQIIRFSNTAQAFAPGPVPATPAHIARALEYVEHLSGSGGTIMLEGVKGALGYPEDPQRLRIISFMTDGYIGNEDQILAYLRDHLGSARLHSFGVGSSVNRHLLDSMAEFGRGSVEYILLREAAGGAVHRFYDRISRPYLTDITIDWGGLKVADVFPSEIPDLFLGEPIQLSGRYLEPGVDSVRVRARLGGRPWEGRFDVQLPERHPEGDAVATLWARAHIEELSKRLVGGRDQVLVEQVTTIALEHNLVSAYTSFVAIDEMVRNAGGPPVRVAVPVPIPEGVDRDMAVGNERRLVEAVTGGATVGFSSEFIDGLPIIGRNYQDILTFAPGQAPKGTGGGVSGMVDGVVGGTVGGVLGGVLGGLADTPETNQGALEVICHIESAQSEYRAGERVEITLSITNLSAATLDVPAALSLADGSARFQIFDDRRQALSDPRAICTDSPRRRLKPGETATFRLALNETGGYRLDTPGAYWVAFLGSDYGLADSNRLTIVVRRE